MNTQPNQQPIPRDPPYSTEEQRDDAATVDKLFERSDEVVHTILTEMLKFVQQENSPDDTEQELSTPAPVTQALGTRAVETLVDISSITGSESRELAAAIV